MNEKDILDFLEEHLPSKKPFLITAIPQAGSDRMYYRLRNEDKKYIFCYSNNVEENKRFIGLANYFFSKKKAVPKIVAVNESMTCYVQTDGGAESLLDRVLADGHTEQVKRIYRNVLLELIDFQCAAKDNSFQALFMEAPSFGPEQVLYDLNYFKNNFLSRANIDIDEHALAEEFSRWANDIGNKEQSYFMYRDCQGRNIMLNEQQHLFIDFQGGLKGHPVYDVVSLLWQAKAQIPRLWKMELVDMYLNAFAEKEAINVAQWKNDYVQLTLTRLLQVLGAYGLRGLIEGKSHFISSIPLGLNNIKEWLLDNELNAYPELQKVLQAITKKEFINTFE